MRSTVSDAEERGSTTQTYLYIVFVHLAYSPAVKVQHANAAANGHIITVAVQCSQVDRDRAETFLDFSGDGIEKVVEWAELPQWQWCWMGGHCQPMALCSL